MTRKIDDIMNEMIQTMNKLNRIFEEFAHVFNANYPKEHFISYKHKMDRYIDIISNDIEEIESRKDDLKDFNLRHSMSGDDLIEIIRNSVSVVVVGMDISDMEINKK